MAYDNDQGGAIDDEAPDISQQAPPVEDDATGVDQAQEQQQQPAQPQQQQLSEPQGPLAPLAKRIISYLSGAAAAPPESIDAAARQVDPQGALSPADRNIMALDKIREQGGDQAAWPIMQANRVAYNAKTAFAKTALTGTPQKPADLNAALQAANQAQTHVLDGSNVVFSQHNGMVTATVTGPGSPQAEHIQLTPQAFGKFLDVGGDGQWDKVMEHSAPETLKRLAAEGSQQPQPGQGGLNRVSQLQQQQPKQDPQSAQAEAPAPQPGKVTRREYQRPEYSGALSDEQAREKRSYALFPRAHLDEGENAKREAWLNSEDRADTKEQTDRIRASHDWTVESAKIKANGAAVIQQQKALEAARKMEMNHQDASMRERGRMARSEMSNPNFVLQDDATRAKILQKYGIQTGDAQAPAPASKQPQQQQQPQSVPAVNQRVTGQVYTTPKGQFKWMGNGWQPVQ